MRIRIDGINDRCANVPEWIKNAGKSYLSLTELPVTQNTACSVFSLLNNRSEAYFSSETKFTEHVNNYFKTAFGFKVNPMILNLIYRMKENYVFCYPIGCIDEFDYKNKEIDNILRFNRSVAITNNALNVLKDYQKTIDSKRLAADKLFEKLSSSEELKNIYIRGNKLKFLEEMLNYFFLYSGSEAKEAKPSVSKAVLEEMINASFDYTGDEKVYINPLTFSKIYYKIKESFNPELVDIKVGEPHRIFLQHFLSQRFPEVSSESKTLEFLKTDENTDYVKQEIKIAEKEKLIII